MKDEKRVLSLLVAIFAAIIIIGILISSLNLLSDSDDESGTYTIGTLGKQPYPTMPITGYSWTLVTGEKTYYLCDNDKEPIFFNTNSLDGYGLNCEEGVVVKTWGEKDTILNMADTPIDIIILNKIEVITFESQSNTGGCDICP